MNTHVPSSIESSHLVCAPVTALAYISATLLLVGQGPYLKLYQIDATIASDSTPDLLLEERILSSNRIHGLVQLDDATRSGEVGLLVFGGQEVAWVKIWIDHDKLWASSLILVETHRLMLSFSHVAGRN